MKFKRPRGTSDLYGVRMELWHGVERILSRSLRSYGYTEIRTPIFEGSELFVRAVGEGTDIVTKEMYTFLDKKGRSLTLRPENTAPVIRAYLENGLHRKGGIARFYYIGPMFRYDRPQAGRYRQFHQVGAEIIGSSNPAADAEIIDVSLDIYRLLNFPRLDVRLNSVGCPVCRPDFIKILKQELAGLTEQLCDNCAGRAMTNPLRIFDCKECVGIKKKLPVITDYLCSECSDHFTNLQEILREMGIKYTLDPLLVRGLDYYTRTAFEIVHPGLGAQNALCGGGRYDGLAEDCGGDYTPAVGFSAGIERLIETIPEDFAAGIRDEAIDVYFVVLEAGGLARALSLSKELRSGGLTVEIDLSLRNVRRQLRTAAELGAGFAVFLGTDELEQGVVTVKNMATGEQCRVAYKDLDSHVKKEREGGLE